MSVTGLREADTNIAVEDSRVVHCPNCSKMYRLADDQGKSETLPESCKRCGCPMNLRSAEEWMNNLAVAEHDPALASLGNRSRELVTPNPVQTETPPIAPTKVRP